MIFYSILICLLLSSPIFANEEWMSDQGAEGHGGDPVRVFAEEYPDRDGLSQAIQTLTEHLNSTPYPEKFKQDLLREADHLFTQRKFRMLPGLIILTPESAPEGYPLPTDRRNYIALGGMTWNALGEDVILAERTLRYSKIELAKVILHEVAHHVLEKPLAEDDSLQDGFVGQLAETVFSGRYRRSIQLALELGIYVRPGKILKDQFLRALDMKSIFSDCLFGDDEEFCDEYRTHLKEKIRAHLPSNLADTPIWDVRDLITHFAGMNARDSIKTHLTTTYRMHDLALKLNPSNPWVNRKFRIGLDWIYYWGLRRMEPSQCNSLWDIFFHHERCIDRNMPLLMKDLYTVDDDLEPDAPRQAIH